MEAKRSVHLEFLRYLLTIGQQSDGSFRKKWDREEYAEKAKVKDEEERERMKENDARMRQGKKPRRIKEELPKPTELMKAREEDLELEKNLNKTIVVHSAGGRGPGQPGFYCEVCTRNFKDTAGYLDHINSRAHLRKLGQTTTVERSTVEQVRARIALLREKTKEAAEVKAYDFEKRLQQIRNKELEERQAKRRKVKEEKQAIKAVKQEQEQQATEANPDMLDMMGFAGFGGSKR
ncbi:hypothetical protein DACRYDRAFT_48200 [Dacryopinax primogenitus]|uniref:C2H2-type domain-containing protein n=1 Tax=Dacryopinax primogenitus (strain DJM 731) TaxID=1858805 RepID=M5GCU2_DACPD|nr:uncharacterized protein DACRYDRAFT_48200 [Dacryopinax primogenitus]EJU04062.1 hypothetical protein DACRYDRAFT_48200 [Dacryopinax primogenitus]